MAILRIRNTRSKFNVSRKGLGAFGSQTEKRRFEQLEMAEKAGSIRNLVSHLSFLVEPQGCESIRFTPDACYEDLDGTMSGKAGIVAEDYKPRNWKKLRGMGDAKVRMRLFRWKFPLYRLIIVTEVRGRFQVEETGKKVKCKS